MKYPILKLKPGKDAHVKNRHHSIFQNAIAIFPDVKDGSIVQVVSSRDEFVGYAMLNRKAYISARSISFEEGDPLAVMKRNIEQAIAMRKELMQKEDTNAIRLINAEGDGIPGLIVDQYNDVLAVQFTTLGMDLQKEWVIDVLEKMIKPKAIFEKSSGSARKKEGLPDREGWLKGTAKEPIEIRERGITFLISLTGSQKTGLFLDQREMRSLVRSYSEGKTVLDCCSYVGGFSVSALLGGAKAENMLDHTAVIPRAVEKRDLASGGQPVDVALEIPLRCLRFRRLWQRYNIGRARVQVFAQPLDRASFACRVAPLEQHDKALAGGLQIAHLRISVSDLGLCRL